MHPATAWTKEHPTQPGYYELWDPHRGINRIVHVFRTPDGALAVRNFCKCKYAFLLRMWMLPCFASTHWRGPLHVPEGVAADQSTCLIPTCDHPGPEEPCG